MSNPFPPQPQAVRPHRPILKPTEASAEHVVLVDERGEAIGTMPKLAAHQGDGRLHLAFSIFLFDDQGRMLIQRRATGKYHFASLWTNACCSHPRPGETISAAADRRLGEELGLSADLVLLLELVYSARDPASGLIEREYDHVLAGRLVGTPQPCEDEVSVVALRHPEALLRDCARNPERFTPWFRLAMQELDERGHLAEWGTPLR